MDQTEQPHFSKNKTIEKESIETAIIRFAGDSGDGIQITGDRFASNSAILGNDVVTLADYPAEIRAPLGTTYGVSGYQVQVGKSDVYTPGDAVDILVAMNPAALQVNLKTVKKNGIIIANSDAFNEKNLEKAGFSQNPLEDDSLSAYRVHGIEITTLTQKALDESPLNPKEKARCKNFFALGLVSWLLDRPIDGTIAWLKVKFKNKPEIANANVTALKEGWNAGDIRELFQSNYTIPTVENKLDPGKYRFISGNSALSLGLIAAGKKAGKKIVFASYPITPASDILHEMNKHRNFDITTFQAEDEIAACGAALGSSYSGALGVTSTSGPGMALKSEFIGLAVMTELPLVILDIQRAGPSTGLPTKTEQGDLLMALWGRNGESPCIVLAPQSPSDCFEMAYIACDLAMKYMSPVVLLSDSYLANGHEAWKLPKFGDLPQIQVTVPTLEGDKFLPYKRDKHTLARPWAKPGLKGFEHRIGGLEKELDTGNVCQEPENHARMVALRAAKIEAAAKDVPQVELLGEKRGSFLVLGWGSSYGAIRKATQNLIDSGKNVSSAHLRSINPFPANLAEVIDGFEKILVPENNLGQLIIKLRHEYPNKTFEGFSKVTGQPFRVSEIESAVLNSIGGIQ